jgi:hypothetical protein
MRYGRLICLAALAWLSACSAPLGPDRGDPAQFLLASPATFVCGGWRPARPIEALGLFDIYFSSSPATSAKPASSASVRRLAAIGGTVVKRFHVNGVRAILPIAAAATLDARALLAVRDVELIEHQVDLGFTTSGKVGVILANGGRVVWMGTTIPDFFAIVPDAAIPRLWRDPDLRFLELSLPDCVGFD